MGDAEVREVIAQLTRLLNSYGFERQARQLDESLRVNLTVGGDALRGLESSQIWGSAGTVWDVSLVAKRPADSERVAADDSTLKRLLLRLAKLVARDADPGTPVHAALATLATWKQQGLM